MSFKNGDGVIKELTHLNEDDLKFILCYEEIIERQLQRLRGNVFKMNKSLEKIISELDILRLGSDHLDAACVKDIAERDSDIFTFEMACNHFNFFADVINKK